LNLKVLYQIQKSTLNNWFSDTPEQKQQKFSIIVNGASSEFKQALEAESGQTLEQIKQKTNFNANKNIPETPDWVDDALAQINRNPFFIFFYYLIVWHLFSLLFILNKQIITRDIFICRGFVFEFIFNLLNTIHNWNFY
jgi:hypothetical protein